MAISIAPTPSSARCSSPRAAKRTTRKIQFFQRQEGKTMSEVNIAETAAELALKSVKAEIVQAKDGREYLIVPEGMTKHDVPDEHGLKRTMPAYLHQTVTLETVESL